MATFKEALDYAQKNPDSPFATDLRKRIETGEVDSVASQEGVDLKQFRSQRGVPEPAQTGNENLTPLGNLAAGVAKGVGSTIRGAGQLGSQIGTVLNLPGQIAEYATDGRIKAEMGSDIYKPDTAVGQKVSEALDPKGRAQEIGFLTEQIAEFLIPSAKIAKLSRGKSLIERSVVESSVLAGQTAVQQGEINDEVKTNAIIGALFPPVGATLKAGVKALAPSLVKAGEAIEFKLIKPTARDIEGGFDVKNVTKYGVGGSLNQSLAKTEKAITERVEKLNQVNQKIKGQRVAVDINRAVTQTIEDLSKSKMKNFGDLTSIENVLTKLNNEVIQTVGRNGMADFVEAQLIKQAAGRKGAWTFGFVDPDGKATEVVYSVFYRNLNKQMREVAEASGNREYVTLNKELSEIIPIQNALIRRSPVAQRQNAISLTDTIQLSAAMFNPKLLALYGLDKLARSGNVAEFLVKAGQSLKAKEPTTAIGERVFGGEIQKPSEVTIPSSK